VIQIYGDVDDIIDEYSNESVIKENNSCNVYGIDRFKFYKIIEFIDLKNFPYIEKIKIEKVTKEFIDKSNKI
jgi:hypothetical protein